jgi:hypothetical protein
MNLACGVMDELVCFERVMHRNAAHLALPLCNQDGIARSGRIPLKMA